VEDEAKEEGHKSAEIWKEVDGTSVEFYGISCKIY
jgi:hypothetical protein